jgi:hypothetical protein
MGTTISITGEPLVRFIFDYIPSWNEHLTAEVSAALHRRNRWHTAKWRIEGRDMALRFMAECGPRERRFLIQKPGLAWIKIYRATENIYDVPNVYSKAIYDGFTDASIWPDDEWAFVPYALNSWTYLDPEDSLGQRFEIEVHELEAIYINGVAQVLPLGRRGVEGWNVSM